MGLNSDYVNHQMSINLSDSFPGRYTDITFNIFDKSFLLAGEEIKAGQFFDGIYCDSIFKEITGGGVIFHEKCNTLIGRVGDIDDDLKIVCRHSHMIFSDKFINSG